MFARYIFAISVIYHCLVVCRSSCPQNTFKSGTFRMCADKCLSGVALQGCINPDNVLDKTQELIIYTNTAAVWRRGAINDLPELTHVSALAAHISRIKAGAFLNLPKLKKMDLAYNEIEEVEWGVFSNSSLEIVDLERNLISYIENEAFSNMPNLKSVFLNYNKIKEVDRNWFVNSYGLERLLLSYNEIEKIRFFTFSVFPNMKYLDLSFNRIKEIDGGAFDNIRVLNRLDLTGNRLSWLSTDIFKAGTEVKELRLPLNRLSFLSTIVLETGNVKSISLYPNPWQCPCLDAISGWMYQHNITLNDPSDDHRINYNRNLPFCSFNSKSKDKCVVGYDDDFLKAQEIFFREVNYTDSVRQKPTSQRPDYDHLITAKPFSENLSPIS